ncbi:polyprenyl diphosphate synthase [Plasticicumulans acidivorans]|uniref:Ditrans,polycis-undecaprenyl-diphosphate synthase ((2E,6E)-farnesyl-diphosphate specific) n=1 Tax=Plasticicumulans acidivorans TaxID=886464 RepID=A0A317MXQ8_9GAMM|nr:polyprenyl diphosphate synthase [Plasticicumulans acidivorans]PWV63520.1 undecaprenyl pyrophosphate synthetase [Plasticicumulans acidivorans]
MTSADTQETGQGLPRHVAIIMDGNGRWAKQRRLPRPLGHREGVKSLRRVVQHGIDRGLEAMTLFAFSSENWRRPALEVKLLMELFSVVLRSEIKRLMDNNARLRFIGDRSAFSSRLCESMRLAEETTGRNTGMTLVIAANYGGRWDIAQAARRAALDVVAGRLAAEDITAETLSPYMSLADLPEPDLFIRTGGEERISNFLLWQMAYTEFYFTECLWPDFDEAALDTAMLSFAGRQRRFGRTGDQVEQRGGA